MSSGRRRSITQSTAIATVATSLSYAAALVQQLVYARILGVSPETDALAAALAIAVAVTGVIGTTFVSVALPVHVAALAGGAIGGSRMFYRAAGAAGLVTIGCAAAVAVGASPLAALLLPGASAHTQQILAEYLRAASVLMLPWMASIGLTADANAQGRFGLAALSSALPSVVVIAALVGFRSPSAVIWAYALGFVCQALLLAFANGIPRAASRATPGDTEAVRRNVVPIGVAFLLLNASNLVVRAAVSTGRPGDVSIFDYATRLTTAIETIALSGALAVVLTSWSAAADKGSASFRRTMVVASVGSGALAAGMIVAAPLAAALLFGSHDLDRDELELALRLVAVAMAGRMVHMVAVRRVLASQRGGTMAAIGSFVLAAVALCSFATLQLHLAGLLAGYSVAWLAGAVFTFLAADRLPPPQERSPTAKTNGSV